jgi:hypothetical protein
LGTVSKSPTVNAPTTSLTSLTIPTAKPMRRISAVLLILLSTAGQCAPATAENEPKVITLSCDGTLTGTYGADKPKNMEASQKISVVVDLGDQTVFFLGYVVPIYDVDQASINFGGRQTVDYGFSIIIRGHIDRASGRMEVTTVTTKPDDPNIATLRYDVGCEATNSVF